MARRPTETKSAFLSRKTCGCKKTKVGDTPTEKKPYLSRYGGGYIGASQWLAETMCERRAKFERRNLELRFWDKEPDGSFFMAQVRAASGLLKRFPIALIIEALNMPESSNCYSLGAGWFIRVLNTLAQSFNKSQAEDQAEVPERPQMLMKLPSVAQQDMASKKSLLDRLRGPIDGQGETRRS